MIFYFVPAILILLLIYPISFAKYIWSRNKFASLGMILLIVAAVVLSAVLMAINR